MFDRPFQVDAKVGELLNVMEATIQRIVQTENLAPHDAPQDQKNTIRILRQVNECLNFLNMYTRLSYCEFVDCFVAHCLTVVPTGSISMRGVTTDYVSVVDNFVANLHKMNDEFDTTRRIATEVQVHRLVNAANTLVNSVEMLGVEALLTILTVPSLTVYFTAIRAELDTLKIAEGADYNPEKMCLPGTRVNLLQKVRTWINGEGEQADTQAFLLLGPAGAGKSAIAHRIADEYKAAKRLAASYCFSQGRGADNLFRTIARQLADLDPAYASALTAITSDDSSLKTTSYLTPQVTRLLQEPLQSLSVLGTLLIVIDALDECYVGRDDLVRCLHKYIPHFPKNIRFLITSRPSEADHLQQYPWVHSHMLKADKATSTDIYRFVEHQLQDDSTKQPREGFGMLQFQAIVDAAEGIFQYATVVCKEIIDVSNTRWESPSKVFTRLVTNGSHGLDSLYSHILTNAYKVAAEGAVQPETAEQLGHFQTTMGRILHAQKHLSCQILSDFASIDLPFHTSEEASSATYGTVAGVLHPLGALLAGLHDVEEGIYPLHSSFRDFLTDRRRSGNFYIGPEEEHHVGLAVICLKIMEGQLHFNMAGLENSYIPNHEIPDFSYRVQKGISSALSYSCSNWARHLQASGMKENQFSHSNMVEMIIEDQFLYWLEAQALQKQAFEVKLTCKFLEGWVKVLLSINVEYDN